MPGKEDRNLKQTITRLALLIACATVVVTPAIYFYTAYSYQAANLEAEARRDADSLSVIVFRYQEMWSFQEPRIEALLAHASTDDEALAKRVLDAEDELVAETATTAPAPVMVRSAPVMTGARTVGRVEVAKSMRPILLGTGFAALSGFILGIAMFIVMRNFPLRALLHSMQNLSEANREIRKLNEKLKSKVVERTIELRQSELSLANAQRMAHIGSWERDLKSNRTYWSDETYRILGFEPQAVEPDFAFFKELSDRKDLAATSKALRSILKGEKFSAAETRITRPDGQQRHLRHLAEVVFDEKGQPARLSGTIEDITERRHVESALAESETRFRDLIEGSIEGIVIDRVGKPLFANQAYADIFGYDSPDEILGLESLSVLYPPGERERIEKYRSARMAAEYAPSEYDFQGVRKDGSGIWLTNMARLVTWDGEDAIQSTLIDITARKAAEDQLAENAAQLEKFNEDLMQARQRLEEYTQDLEAANDELSQYAHVVSHDLKAPLRAIHNYSDFLAEDLSDSLDEEQKTYLEGMGRAVRQSEDLVEDLLSLSRIGRKDAPAEVVDLGKLLRELVDTLKPDDDAEIRMPEDWPHVEVSPSLIRQVFQNFITNAFKFNVCDKKKLDIEWRENDDETYEIHFKDNGIGIESRFLDKIFVIFQRLHTAEEYEGTGIGLAIVKKAVVKMGGSVHVESRFGKGSTFLVSIPKRKGRHAK